MNPTKLSNHPWLGTAVAATWLLLSTAPALGQDAEAEALVDAVATEEDGSRNRVEEIVVTARKRAELLEDTPISVTALGPQSLIEAGVKRLDDIRGLVPNLTFDSSPEGNDALVKIRGVGTQRASAQFDPGVGIYVDGVFLARSAGGLVDILDVQQIEVLRGPQGTLFGKNTVGGAVSITTQKPHNDFEGSVRVRGGNFETVNSRLMLNVPIIEDKILTRFSVGSDHIGGYVDNPVRDEKLSNRDSLNFLATVRFLPVEDLTIDITGNWSRMHSDGRAGRCVFVTETGLQNLATGYADECRRSEPLRVESNLNQIVDLKSYGVWGTIQYDLGEVGFIDDLQIKSISAWRQQVQRNLQDPDGTALPVIRLSNVGGAPLDGHPTDQTQISTEFQVNASMLDNRLNVVTGAFAYWEDSDWEQIIDTLPGVLNSRTRNEIDTDNWNWALFAQGTFDVTEWLSLTGGVRYTEEKKGIRAFNRNVTETGVDTGQDPQAFGNNSAIFSAWTPMASIALTLPADLLDETPIDHLMAYFTYSRGFRGGGFNALGRSGESNVTEAGLPPFRPETLDSFEVGLKMIAFEQRLTANLSLFTADYDDIQVISLRETGDPDGDGVPNIQQITLNAASAETRGLELEMTAVPVEDLVLRGSIGLLDTEFKSFPEAVSDLDGSTIDRAGETFNNTPEFQAQVAIAYTIPVEGTGMDLFEGTVTPRVDWNYQSKVHMRGPEIGRLTVQRGFGLLNARLGYRFNDGDTEIALWARNLTDQLYFNNSTPLVNFFGVTLRYYETPRTYGAEITHRF